jgi:helix-turn-helix protein
MANPIGKASQGTLLLRHFEVNPSISGLEAAAILKVRSLPKRICELKAAGHKFSKELRRDSTGQKYMRYTYKGKTR